MTGLAATYMILSCLPMLLGAACLSGPLVRILYGAQYLPAISVFALVAIFAIPKSILAPAQTLLYATEDLGFLLKWGCMCAAVNIVFDLLLIPNHGAYGAAVANGMAQTLAAVGIWWRAISRFDLGLQVHVIMKVVVASLLMATSVLLVISRPLPITVKAIAGVLTGIVAFLISLRLISALQDEDRQRLISAGSSIPGGLKPWYNRIVNFVVPGAASIDTEMPQSPSS
jgi:O-antigen/teichoic acid export membrane protein